MKWYGNGKYWYPWNEMVNTDIHKNTSNIEPAHTLFHDIQCHFQEKLFRNYGKYRKCLGLSFTLFWGDKVVYHSMLETWTIHVGYNQCIWHSGHDRCIRYRSLLVHRTRISDRKCSAIFLSGRCGAHSIHTALQFLFRPGLMMHAGIYPLLPGYFPRFVEARFDGANKCASAHAHVSYTSVCLQTLSCVLIDTFGTGLSPRMFSNLIEISKLCITNFLVSLDAFNVQKKGDLLNWMF